MKVTLQVNGREKSLSEEELTTKLEKLEKLEQRTIAVAQRPTEGEWFEVDPIAIDLNLFLEKRENLFCGEQTRQLILEALIVVHRNPERYSKKFKTMMPKKNWSKKTVRKLQKYANKKGDCIATWVEQALEWAQRIQNGETWEEVCNKADTANWYRLVIWKNGDARTVGGSCNDGYRYPASYVCSTIYSNNDSLKGTVPLIVHYEE